MKWNRPNAFVQDAEEQANWDSLALYLDSLSTTGSGGAPSGPAGGDLAGTYPNPTVKASVALTGTPTVPTAAVDTNTTQAASTAFVIGQASASLPLIDGTATIGTSTRFARADHIHPTDTTRAALASPTFTGDPKAPTPTVGDNDTSIATTAFVQAALPTSLPPSGGASGDLAGSYPAPTIKASVGLTGNPTAATQSAGDNSTRLATTAFVAAAIPSLARNFALMGS